jgi:hypothetical protein
MMLQFTSFDQRQMFQRPIKHCQTLPAGKTRLVPNAIDIGVLLIERTSKCTARCVVACVRGYRMVM